MITNPNRYLCYHTKSEIEVDGDVSKAEWAKVPYTDFFHDIEGTGHKPEPFYKTRMKMV